MAEYRDISQYVKQYSIYGVLVACAALAKWSFDTERRLSVLEDRFNSTSHTLVQLNAAVDQLELSISNLNQTGAVITIQQQRNNEDIRRLLDVLQTKFNPTVKNTGDDE